MDPATDADTYETKLIDGDIVILFVSPNPRTSRPAYLIELCL